MDKMKKKKKLDILNGSRDLSNMKMDEFGIIIPTEAKNTRTGSEYQADIPSLLSEDDRQPQKDKALLIWSPPDLSEEELIKIDKYLEEAEDTHFREQALGVLFLHKYNIVKAKYDLENYLPDPEWIMEEMSLFDAAYDLYGKNFRKYVKLFPPQTKTVGDIIRYYYDTKRKDAYKVSGRRKKEKEKEKKMKKEEEQERKKASKKEVVPNGDDSETGE